MGLATVHCIISKYGGAITVHSEAGDGAAFNVFPPTVEGNLEGKTAPQGSLSIPT